VEHQVGSNMLPQSVSIDNQIQPQVSSQGVTLAGIEKINPKIVFLDQKRLRISNTDYIKLSKNTLKWLCSQKLFQHKCSNCGKTGHNSYKYPRKRRANQKKVRLILPR
jgi:hypothetical protein